MKGYKFAEKTDVSVELMSELLAKFKDPYKLWTHLRSNGLYPPD